MCVFLPLQRFRLLVTHENAASLFCGADVPYGVRLLFVARMFPVSLASMLLESVPYLTRMFPASKALGIRFSARVRGHRA